MDPFGFAVSHDDSDLYTVSLSLWSCCVTFTHPNQNTRIRPPNVPSDVSKNENVLVWSKSENVLVHSKNENVLVFTRNKFTEKSQPADQQSACSQMNVLWLASSTETKITVYYSSIPKITSCICSSTCNCHMSQEFQLRDSGSPENCSTTNTTCRPKKLWLYSVTNERFWPSSKSK